MFKISGHKKSATEPWEACGTSELSSKFGEKTKFCFYVKNYAFTLAVMEIYDER